MKTIEERAKDYAPDAFDVDLILPTREGYIVKVQRVAYIAGATEQRKIEVAKARKVFKEIMTTLYDEFVIGSKTFDTSMELFNKAMKE